MENSKLLSGNEAIARGAYEAGITFASAYPGTPSTEILENISLYKEDIYSHWASNEKTALEEAVGASFTGARSLAAMKHVGVNVAADPLFSASYIGTTGALVIISADDPGMHSSQNEQDNRHYAIAAKIPVLEPSNSQEAKDMVIEGVKISEIYDTPVMIRMTTRVSHSLSTVKFEERENPPDISYKKDDMKRMLLPARARLKHIEVEKRTKKLEKWASRFPYNHIIEGKSSIGVVASGIAYENGRSVFPDAWFLKITTSFPFPRELFTAFASKVETIYVLEENDPIIETSARLAAPDKKIIGKDTFPLNGEMTPDVIRHALGEKDITPKLDISAIPRRPPTLCSGCPHSAAFFTLGTQKVTVSGDIGCYTLGGLPPLNAMDTCVDMGASITVLLGMEKALEKAGKKNKQVAVIGDSTFFHSGLTGLLDIVYNKGKSTVIILDNSITAMTGHQHNPGSGQTLMGEETPRVDIVKLVKEGFGIANTFAVDGYDVKGIRSLIKQEIEKDEPSVIVIQRPCALLFRGARWSPMTVDRDKCIYCKTCLKVGCPAITSKEKKSHIVEEMCKGCTVCAQLCPVQAISFKDPDGTHIYSTPLEDFTGGK